MTSSIIPASRIVITGPATPSWRRRSLALGWLLLAVPVLAATPAEKKSAEPAKVAKATQPRTERAAKVPNKAAAKSSRPAGSKGDRQQPGKPADFGAVEASGEVVHVANWVSYTRNHNKKAFVIIDKKNARLYVFDPQGKLKSHAPVLLGKAVGDHTAPGVGNKPLSQLKEEEKTTPAGRFLVEPGRNNHREDILWIDYNSAVSMHRLRKVAAEERRAERLASSQVDDNRISNGCVNVPPAFYNGVLKPTVLRHGAYVYVLPETKTPQQLFGSYDIPKSQAPVQLAQASEPGRAQGKAGSRETGTAKR